MSPSPEAYAAALVLRLESAEAVVCGPAAQTVREAVARQREMLLSVMGDADPEALAPLPAEAEHRTATDQIAALSHAYAAAAAATRGQPGPLPALFERFELEIEAIVTGA